MQPHILNISIVLIQVVLVIGRRDTHNEEHVGKAIGESGVPREEIFVTTKLWYVWVHSDIFRTRFTKIVGTQIIIVYKKHLMPSWSRLASTILTYVTILTCV